MATLQKLRSRAGFVLIAFIGLALISFIIGDIFGNQQGGSIFGGNPNEIARISGEGIHVQEYQQLINDLEENRMRNTGRSSLDQRTRVQIMESAWDMLVQQHVMNEAYEELGLAVSGEELFDLIQGNDPHPIIKNNFTNPETGQLNRTQLLRFLKSVAEGGNPEQRELWLPIEKQIYRQRRMSKYVNLIQKGLYINPLQTQNLVNANTTRFDIEYIQKRYSDIPDTAVKVTEKAIKEYYETHKNEYKQEASRTVEYVSFDVEPSGSDVQAAKQWIDNISSEFEDVQEVEQFVNLNSDVQYDRTNYAPGELPARLDSALFDAAIGTTYGPYREDEAFKIAKLAEINYVSDSVNARHILIQPNQRMNYQQAQQLADSLLTQIENGANFAQIARANSADRGSAQDGGDLGWFTEGTMVAPINDTAFYGEVGDLKLVNSQFGIHILEILDQSPKYKKVQVGVLVRNIEPSDVTYENYYQQASEFAGTNRKYEDFKNAAEEKGMRIRTASGLQEMTQIVHDLDNPREMVKWAFDADKNEVSAVFELGDKFVVASLTEINKEGFADLDEVRNQIEFELKKELKAEKIKQSLNEVLATGSSISAIASQLGRTVQNASGVNANSRMLQGAGTEPGVIAVASMMEENVISAPIAGTNGVYLITISNKEQTQAHPMMVQQQKSVLQRSYVQRANYQSFEALKGNAKIEDSRSKFY
ncbi:MAG: peptidylprolyl isomerase [Bacteroidetes bacterium]|jgi:peptidyl-prolyl cis-trans isomerase D|nr:peptidylprolyl isomerase [Bacteroidota bacterium]